jgi:TPR repeat protein
MQGTDVLHDFDEARKWLEPAAREGDVAAKRDMVTPYAHGWGAKKDAIRAYIWFDYAASRGDPRSESRVSTGSKA